MVMDSFLEILLTHLWLQSISLKITWMSMRGEKDVFGQEVVQNTYIPVYTVYNRLWLNVGIECPLMYDWLGFDKENPTHMATLENYVYTLTQQKLLWNASNHTKLGGELFKQIEDFIFYLEELLEYTK